MGIISVEQTNRLLWLGRYTERVYTTLKLFSNSFDIMLDEITDSYEDFCKMIDIPNVYGSKQEFTKSYPFDENNPDSIASNLNRAYDNAIVLREEIGSESLSYIQLAIYEMNKAKISKAPLIELQRVIDNLSAFWGMIDDTMDDHHHRNILKTGKRIERIDLYARLSVKNMIFHTALFEPPRKGAPLQSASGFRGGGMEIGIGRKELKREIERLAKRIEGSGMEYDHEKMNQIIWLCEQDSIDYYAIVQDVESLVTY